MRKISDDEKVRIKNISSMTIQKIIIIK